MNTSTKIDMVKVPAGTFTMGSPVGERNSAYENPQHVVTITSFLMGKYPVTQAQWKEVAKLPKVNIDLDVSPSYFKRDDFPVESISWYESIEFCDRLSRETGKTVRLPTEAEWEYACRAGTATTFYFGETITSDLANYDGSYPWSVCARGKFREATVGVRSFSPNPFGLYGMYGNVWDWCQDHWHGGYRGAPIDGSAWLIKGDSSSYRVIRGGSWEDLAIDCRSASRGCQYPDQRENTIGFRIVEE